MCSLSCVAVVSSQQGTAASEMLKLSGNHFFEINFILDPLCSGGKERWLLVLSPVGTEISAVEENRGEMLAQEPRLAVLMFLVVKQLVSYRHVWLSVELQTVQTCDCEM